MTRLSILRRNLLKLPVFAFLAGFSRNRANAAQMKPWHLKDGRFSNNYIDPIEKSFADLRRAFAGERPPPVSFPLFANDPTALAANRRETTITWVGHATFLIQMAGLNILTDPHLSERASPVSFAGPRRTTAPGLDIDQLPDIDAVLITHNHYDHLDWDTVIALRKRHQSARFLVPLRLAEWFGFGDETVSEHDWWEHVELGRVKFTAVPAQHWSNRVVLDRNRTLWVSWVLESPDRRLIFVGDSGYSADYADIGGKFGGFDLAILPIGAYEPRWFMRQAHQNPAEAAQARRDLRARRAVASHWGTFQLTMEPMEEPPLLLLEELAKAGEKRDQFWVMRHGETRTLD